MNFLLLFYQLCIFTLKQDYLLAVALKKILAFNGSPRRSGNTSLLLDQFTQGTEASGVNTEVINADAINLKNCQGCLRCNILKRCSIREDDWTDISQKILDADVLVFASPIYFHHVTAPLKMIIDRFRSFVHIQITETSLIHTPWIEWNKDFVLILPMGSSDDIDAQPVVDLFNYMCAILGPKNRLHVVKGTRLAVVKQVAKTETDLETLYPKLNLPAGLAKADSIKNQNLMLECFELGKELS